MTDTDHSADLGAFEPTQEGLELPKPSAGFETFEDERRHRKQRLAAGLRVLGRLRLAEGVAGHVTVRDPEHTDHFWVNPFGHNFKLMKVSDLILVSHTGEVVEGNRPVNAAAFSYCSIVVNSRARKPAPGANCRSPTMTTARRPDGSPAELESAPLAREREPFLRTAPSATAVLIDRPPRLSAAEMTLPQPS